MATTTTGVLPTSRNFFIAVLEKLGLPATETNLDALYSVEHLEGDNQRYNPLNVIQPEPGSTPYNSVGVQSYADFATGVEGTATLLSNSHWTGVRAALQRGTSVQDVLSAFQAAYTWDPGIQFPASPAIWAGEANRTVGGASQTYPSSGPAPSVGGAGGGASTIAAKIPGAGVLSDAAKGVLGTVMPFVLKMAFVAGGVTLLVLGAYIAARPARTQAAQLAPLAAAAA